MLANSHDSYQESEGRLNRLVNIAMEGICEWDREERISFTNPALAAMLGYTVDEMLGRPIYDFLDDENRLLAQQYIARCRQGVTEQYDLRLRHKDGRALWAIVSAAALFDSRGEYTGALGVITDITNRKWHEDVMSATFRVLQAAEFSSTPSTYYESVYSAFRDLFPISHFELAIRDPFLEVIYFPYIAGEDNSLPVSRRVGRGLIEYVLHTGLALVTSPRVIERLLKKGDLDPAQTYPVNWVGVPLRLRERTVGVIALQLTAKANSFGGSEIGALEFIATYVSANLEHMHASDLLRESEAVYRAMFEKNSAVKLLVDPRTGEIVEANPAASEFYGYSTQTLRKMIITDINTLPPDQVRTEMSKALHSEQTCFLFTHRLASGETRDVEVYSSPMEIYGRQLLFSIVHDITSRRKAENDLQFRLRLGRLMARVSTDFVATSPVDLNSEVVRALETVGTFINADCACVLQLGPDGKTISSTHVWNSDNMYASFDMFQAMRVEQFTWWMDLLRRGDVVCVPRVADMPPGAENEQRIILAQGIQSFICVPLFRLDIPIGYVGFFSKSAMREWSEGDLDALKMLAQIFANAFERRRIEVAIRRHEQELQTLVEYSPDIISRFDRDMRCIYISSALTQLFGVDPQDIIGKRANELGMPVEEGLLLETTARQVLATGQPATVVVALPYSKAGSSMAPNAIQYFQMRMAAVLDLRGDVESVLCISRDITELERVKQQIEGLNRTLERRVVERTKQLESANLYLQLEVAQHERHKVELLASRTRLRNVAQQVVTAQEEERQRISRVLHDEVTQDLMALTMTLAWMQNELPEKETELRQRLDASIVTVEMAMEQIRQLAHDLRPPALDALGLNRALEGYCKALAERMSIQIEYSGTAIPHLPDMISICLYRAVQEGLTNVVKHAQAQHIWVRLRCGSRGIVLVIKDDGQGFNPTELRERMSAQAVPWGVGLRGMQERYELLGGNLSIHSSPHMGTRLTGFIPKSMIKEPSE